jgi:serine/threonine-protein kinase
MQTIGNYHIIDTIGEGGMGIVYKAEDVTLERIVAIKALRPALLSDAEIGARFIREAKILAKLSHSNIVTLYTLVQDEGRLYLAMEYVEGETVKEIIAASGAMTFVRYLALFQQVLEGVGYAHSKGIIHRDIKPGNIMVTQSGTVKITDFGIAKVPGDLRMTASGTRMGTIPYMSPEQINGKPPSFASDIYSLGVTLYEMVTGRTPFRADSEYTLMKLIVEQDAPSPRESCPSVPPHIEKAVVRAISKSPFDRFQSADEFWDAIKPSGEVKTNSMGRTEPNIGIFLDEDFKPEVAQERRPHTRRWTVLLGYSVVVLLVAGLGLSFVFTGRPAVRRVPIESGSSSVPTPESKMPAIPVPVEIPAPSPPAPVAIIHEEPIAGSEQEPKPPAVAPRQPKPVQRSLSSKRESPATRYIEEGQRQHRDGNYVKAKEAFLQALAKDPGNQRAAEGLQKAQVAMEAEEKLFKK